MAFVTTVTRVFTRESTRECRCMSNGTIGHAMPNILPVLPRKKMATRGNLPKLSEYDNHTLGGYDYEFTSEVLRIGNVLYVSKRLA